MRQGPRPPAYQPMSERFNTDSGGVEDPLAEEVQLGASIHLAFEELEPGHLALRLPIAVWKLAGRTHRSILLEARREAFQVWKATGQDRLDPGLQRAGRPLAHHLGKGFRERRDLGNRRIVLLYLRHVRLLGWGALLGTTHEEIRELPGGQTRRRCGLRRRAWARRGQGPYGRSAA